MSMRYILLESPKIPFVEPLPGSEAFCHQSPQAPVNRQAPEEPVNRQSPGDRLEMNCPQHYERLELNTGRRRAIQHASYRCAFC